MMNFNNTQKRRGLLFEWLKRKNENKNETKKKILSSLNRNKNQEIKKTFFLKNFFFKKLKTSISRQQNRCLFTGRIKGFQQSLWCSRHMLKHLASLGKVQNMKKKS